MGDARQEKVSTVLDRASRSAVFKILNEGEPLKMGISLCDREEAISKMKNYKIFVNIVIISLSAIRKKYLIKWN
jgi:hypothetical protein